MSDDVTGARKGDYLILGTLGAGGMGKVYKVRNTLSDRVEAMKVLLPDLSEQKDLADRFLREIKVLAGLHHPNIAELRTALTIGNQLVMIMEYVEGGTLAHRLLQGPIRYADTFAYFDQVLAALACAHSRNIVHRDIKPANIMLTPDGIIKLMDFGIARSGNDLGLTMTGTTLGSVAYMSPEQIRCEPIDGRSDLYSVGVSLYECITGQRPYVSDNNFELMQAHLQIPPTSPIDLKPDISLALSELILMAMAKNPALRFQTADALRAALKSVAPSFGEPSKIAAAPASQSVEVTAPSTPRPFAPVAPGSEPARPVTARPITARPITARPVAVGATPLAPTVPLSEAISSPHDHAQLPLAVAPSQVGKGKRRPLFIAFGSLAGLAILAAGGLAIPRWMHARFPASHAPTPATVPPVPAPLPMRPQPTTVSPAKSLPCQPGSFGCGNNSSGKSFKPSSAASVKGNEDEPSATPNVSPPEIASPPSRPAQKDARAAEEAARATADSVAQIAALEHEELDELSDRAGSIAARVSAFQSQQGQQLPRDILESQQRVQHYIVQAQSALRNADVQNAQKYMDQASAELDKLEKSVGR